MSIIDSVRAGPSAQPQPAAQPASQQPGQQPAQGNQGPSDALERVMLAVHGMLFDKRMAAGERIAKDIASAKDPAAVIANTAHDLVSSAVEKTKARLQPDEFKVAVTTALKRLSELAEAVGVDLGEDDGAQVSPLLQGRLEEAFGQQQGDQA